MSTVHITTPDGNKYQYQENEVQDLIRRNVFPTGTVYWQEGMADWGAIEKFNAETQSLNPYTPFPTNAEPLQANRPTKTYIAKSMAFLTNAVVVFMCLNILMEIVSLVSSSMQLSLFSREFTEQEAASNDIREGLVAIAALGLYLLTAIFFLKWLYRANANSHTFGADAMIFTPGWSVGYFFIPFMNLFKPYQAVQEISKVTRDPADWRSQPNSFSVTAWWFLWIATGILGQIAMRASTNATTIEQFKVVTIVAMVGSVVSIVLCIFVIRMVHEIGSLQDARIEGSR